LASDNNNPSPRLAEPVIGLAQEGRTRWPADPLPRGESVREAGDTARKVCIAQIGAAHGIRGEVRLRSFTEDPRAVTSYGPLESEDGTRHFEIAALRPAKDIFVARLKGVDDRNAAERLTNLKLYVPRDRLPPVDEPDTFYHADLVGLAAVTQAGAMLGTVTAIHNYGAGDVIEIAPAGGGAPLTVPFTDTAVPTIDIAGGRIVVVPPAVIE
jgi:16S rRNA processing protein RimM